MDIKRGLRGLRGFGFGDRGDSSIPPDSSLPSVNDEVYIRTEPIPSDGDKAGVYEDTFMRKGEKRRDDPTGGMTFEYTDLLATAEGIDEENFFDLAGQVLTVLNGKVEQCVALAKEGRVKDAENGLGRWKSVLASLEARLDNIRSSASKSDIVHRLVSLKPKFEGLPDFEERRDEILSQIPDVQSYGVESKVSPDSSATEVDTSIKNLEETWGNIQSSFRYMGEGNAEQVASVMNRVEDWVDSVKFLLTTKKYNEESLRDLVTTVKRAIEGNKSFESRWVNEIVNKIKLDLLAEM